MSVLMMVAHGLAAAALAAVPTGAQQGGTPGPAGPATPRATSPQAGTPGPAGPTRPNAGGQGSELVTRIYDLGGMLKSIHLDPNEDIGYWLPLRSAGLNRRVESDGEGAVEEFVGLFQDIHYAELEKVDRMVVTLERGRCLLRMPEYMHQEFQRMAQFYGQLLAARTELQVDVLSAMPGNLKSPGMIAADQVEAWIEGAKGGGASHTSYAVEVPFGGPAQFSNQTEQEFIVGADVQIAQGAVMASAETENYRFGEFGLFAAKAEGQNARVTCAWVVSEAPSSEYMEAQIVALLGSEGKAASNVPLGGQVELTRQGGVGMISNALLSPGKAWVMNVAPTGERPGACVVVRLKRISQVQMDYVGQGGKPFAMRVAQKGTGWDGSLRVARGAEWSNWGWSPKVNENREEPLVLFVDRWNSSLDEYVGGSYKGSLLEEWEESNWKIYRTNMAEDYGFDVKNAELQKVKASLNSVQKETRQFEVRVFGKGATANGAPLASMVTMASFPSHLMQIIEHAEVFNYESEVAQFSAIQAPRLGYSVEGLLLDVDLGPIGDGKIRLDLDGEYRAPRGKRSIEFGSRLQADYSRINYDILDLSVSKILEVDAAGVFRTQVGSTGDKGLGLTIEVIEL